MRFDKLTAKFQQALADGQSLALAADNSYLEAGHVLKAMLDDADGSGAGDSAGANAMPVAVSSAMNSGSRAAW